MIIELDILADSVTPIMSFCGLWGKSNHSEESQIEALKFAHPMTKIVNQNQYCILEAGKLQYRLVITLKI